jgi:hypothetical protein
MPNKTQPTPQDPKEFFATIEPAQKREDCLALHQIMQEVSGCKPILWGNILGYDQYHYKYDTGREGDMLLIGFAPRAKNISIYAAAYNDALDERKKELGKVKLGKSCIYINKLSDINTDLLKEILKESIRITRERYPQE